MTTLKYIPLVMAIAVFTLYYFSPAGRKSGAGLALRIAVALISTIMVAYLFYIFLNRDYVFKYVFMNSNNELSTMYRISAAWAGQEGVLLLWYWMVAVSVLFVRSVKVEYERALYSAMSLMLVMLGVFIAKMSPFELLPEAPTDGNGLNQLLINPWMAIHPPMVFIGYALCTVPFGFAVAGVVNKDYSGWGRAARPWALAAWATLGIGIFLGSYWAYEVLGWGGYWSWDPVENASIFPWIVLGALLHGLIIQGGKKRFALWNVMLAFATALMVVLATFITRSGTLFGASQHTFEKSLIYMPLLISLASFFGLSLVLSFMAGRDLKTPAASGEKSPPLASQLLSWTVVLLIVLVGFVVVGTIFPLLSHMMLGKSTNVIANFYNSTTSIVMIPLGILLLICPFVFIKNAKGVGSGMRYGLAAIGAAAGIAFALKAGVRHPLFIFISAAVGGAILANLVNFYHFLSLKRWNVAAYVVHIGVSLLVIGVITSTVGSKTSQVQIAGGGEGKVGQMSIKYASAEPLETKLRTVLNVKRGQALSEITLDFPFDPEHQPSKPVIIRSFSGDIYFSPRGFDEVRAASKEKGGVNLVTVTQKEKTQVGPYELQLQDWGAGEKHKQMGSVVAIISISQGPNKGVLELPFTPGMPNRDQVEQRSLEDGTSFEIQSIDVTSHTAYIQVFPPGSSSTVIFVDVTRKPFIALLWWGMILIGLGTFLAIFNRKSVPKADAEQVA